MAVVRKKQDDKNLKVLREIVTSGGGNRQCFDCGQKGPTYVNMTIGSFVCTRCSGVLRGLTPPHRVKSISMATFTQEEIDFLKSNGNDACAKTWLGLWDPKRIIHQDQRELMIDKYERKRYYLEPASPLKSLTNATKVTAMNGSNHINNNTSNINNNINNISNKNNSSLDNNLKNISLTPPNSLRLSNNSNGNSMNGGNTTISGNRQQNRYNFQNQFTPEENNFFDTHHQQQQQQQHHNNSNQDKRNSSTANGFVMNGMHSSSQGSNYNRQIVNNNNKNSLNITTNSNETNRNKFTPDSEFVADFSNAKIFNATTPAITIPPPMNGYKTKHYQQQNGVAKNMNNQNNTQITNFMNNANNGITPSSGSMSSSSSATTVTSSSNNDQSNANENFADFDHAPIYNAAGLPMSLNSTSSLSSSATFNSNSSFNSTPPADRYAALKDLDEQLREHKVTAVDSFSTSVAPSTVTSNVNPFKMSPANQTQQQQQHQQISNPFQGNFGQQQTNGFFQSQTAQSLTSSSNIFGSNSAINSQMMVGSNFSNGYPTAMNGTTSNGMNNGNSCGFGFMTQPTVNGGGSISTHKNPFATTSHNSNNPFL